MYVWGDAVRAFNVVTFSRFERELVVECTVCVGVRMRGVVPKTTHTAARSAAVIAFTEVRESVSVETNSSVERSVLKILRL